MRFWNTLKQKEEIGFFLTPEEYYKSRYYYPTSGGIGKISLFLRDGLNDAYNVFPEYMSGWALLEASAEERALLRELGYQLVNL